MENINKGEIAKFIKSCNDLINGKYILVDVKITAILKAIAESDDIYNILAECLINFDFEKEFTKASVSSPSDTTFKVPMEIHKIIPLVFCLLVEINRKHVDFDIFLETQFPYAGDQKERYDKFANNVIAPFRDAVASLFDMSTDVEEKAEEPPVNVLDKHVSVVSTYNETPTIIQKTVVTTIEDPIETAKREEERIQGDFFREIGKLTEQIEEKLIFVRNINKRDNIRTITLAIKQTVAIKNLTILNALVYALNNECAHERALRETMDSINSLYFDFFA